MPENQTALVKISVLGNDDEAVLTRERPDKSVIGAGKVVRFDVGRSRGKGLPPVERFDRTGFRQTEASRCRREEFAFTISREGQARLDILPGQLGEIGEYLILCHSRSEILKDIIDSDPHPPDTWLPATLAGLNGDEVAIVHARRYSWQANFAR